MASAPTISAAPAHAGTEGACSGGDVEVRGRVTNTAGQPKPASIIVWRLTSAGWREVDGIGNEMPSGRWSFRVPYLGGYRVSAGVDHHWSEFWHNKPRLSQGTIVNVTSSTTFISGIDIDVTYCSASTPDFCRPYGFTS